MEDSDFVTASPSSIRLAEAQYCYDKLLSCSGLQIEGPLHDSYFEMNVYIDAYLFSLISIEEMVPEAVKAELNGVDVFKFLKCLRNITAHHVIVAAPANGKFERPFRRYILQKIGGLSRASARLAIDFILLRTIFDYVLTERPAEKSTIAAARIYLAKVEGKEPAFLDEVMLQGLAAVETIVKKPAVD